MKPDGWGSWPAPNTFWKWKNKKNQKESKSIKKAAEAAFLMLQRDAGGEPPLPAQCLGCHTALPAQCLGCHTALPRPATKTSLSCGTLLGLHQGPYRCWLASTGAPRTSSAYSLGEFWVQRHAGGEPPLPFLSLPEKTQPALVLLLSAGAQYGSGDTPLQICRCAIR